MGSIAGMAGAVEELLVPGWIVEIAGVVFWVAAAPYLLSALSSALSLALALLRRAPLARVVTARLGVVALLLGVVSTGALVQFYRSRFLAGGHCGNPHCSVAENLVGESTVLVAAGLAAAVLALFAALAALSAHGSSRRLPVIELALCGVLVFLGLVARRHGLALDDSIGSGDGWFVRRENLEIFAAGCTETTGTLVVGFIVCAVLGAGAWTAVALRRRQECTRAEFAVAALVLFVGLGAFAATRNHSYDAKHLVQHVGSSWTFMAPARLPPPRKCTGDSSLPTVHIDRGQVWVMGTGVGLAGGDGVRTAAHEKLSDIRVQYDELHEMVHEAPDPAPGFDLFARPETPMTQVAPVLEAARGAGYAQANVGSLLPNVTNTRTLGPFVRYSRCATAFDLADDGQPPTAFATWGDLARAAGERRLRLKITPAATP
ncbi:MAG: hypothetical protein ACYC8T_02885 [Myxococcaceae bacterium]